MTPGSTLTQAVDRRWWRYGIASLQKLVSLVVVFWGAMTLFVLFVLGTVMRLTAGSAATAFSDAGAAEDHAQAGGDGHQALPRSSASVVPTGYRSISMPFRST